MTQHPGAALPPYGSPPPSTPEPGAASGPGSDSDDRLAARPVRILALTTAALGLVVYLLGFLDEVVLSTLLAGPLLVGGALLTGAAVLPRAGRLLVPAAVAVTTGALLLLQLVASGGAPAIAVVALILAILEAAAAVGAVLLQTGVVSASALRSTTPKGQPPRQPAQAGPPPGYGPSGGYGQFGAPPMGYGRQQGYGSPLFGGGPTTVVSSIGDQPTHQQSALTAARWDAREPWSATRGRQGGAQPGGSQPGGPPAPGSPSGGPPPGYGQQGPYAPPPAGHAPSPYAAAQPGYGDIRPGHPSEPAAQPGPGDGRPGSGPPPPAAGGWDQPDRPDAVEDAPPTRHAAPTDDGAVDTPSTPGSSVGSGTPPTTGPTSVFPAAVASPLPSRRRQEPSEGRHGQPAPDQDEPHVTEQLRHVPLEDRPGLREDSR